MKLLLEMILPPLIEASILRMAIASGCSSPLGMESGDIGDSQLSASSFWGNVQDWHPREARLRNSKAWYPNNYARDEWLQIDLIERTLITGIQTQGHWDGGPYYASSFKLEYSDNESNWITFQNRGSDKVFNGNNNSWRVKTNSINPEIHARFIRVMAETWSWPGFAFRIELLGCKPQSTTTQTTATTTTTTALFITNVPTTTNKQTTRSTPVPLNSFPVISATNTAGTTHGFTSAVPERSPSVVSSVSSEMSSSSPNNASGNSNGFAGNQTGTMSGAIIGGAVAAGVVIIIIAIVASIFFIRRRRARDTDDRGSPTRADETGTVDNIYYGGVTFTANGNASTNGNVSIGQSEGTVDNHLYAGIANYNVSIDQSEGTVENHLYAGTTNDNVAIDQSEGTVDNHLYAGTTNDNVAMDQSEGTVDNHLYAETRDAWAGTEYNASENDNQDDVYYSVVRSPDEGSVENDIYCNS